MSMTDEEAFFAMFRSDTAFAAAIVSAQSIGAARDAAASYGYSIDVAGLAIALADHAVSLRPDEAIDRAPVISQMSMHDFGDF